MLGEPSEKLARIHQKQGKSNWERDLSEADRSCFYVL